MDKFQNDLWKVINNNATLSLGEMVGVIEHVKIDLLMQMLNRGKTAESSEEKKELVPKLVNRKASPIL